MSLKKTLIFIYLAEESRRIKPGKASVLSIFFTDKRNVEGKEGKHLEKDNTIIHFWRWRWRSQVV